MYKDPNDIDNILKDIKAQIYTTPENKTANIKSQPLTTEKKQDALQKPLVKVGSVINAVAGNNIGNTSQDENTTSARDLNIYNKQDSVKTHDNNVKNNQQAETAVQKTASVEVQPSVTDSDSDIVDDAFRDFFTQSIAVTKPPEKNINIKRKKSGFFKKKFITDSLSLSMPDDIKEYPSKTSSKENIDLALVNDTAENSIETLEKPVISSKIPEDELTGSIYQAVINKSNDDIMAIEEMTGVLSTTSEEPTKASTQQVFKPLADLPKEEKNGVFEEYIIQTEAKHRVDWESDNIVEELKDFKTTLNLRIAMGTICAIALLYLSFAASFSLPLPSFMAPEPQPLIFYLISTLIYGIALIGFMPTIISGIRSFFSDPAPDSLISLACILGLIQMVILCFASSKYTPGSVTIFSSFICITLVFNALGKKLSTNSIIKNLSLANVPAGINAGCIITDNEAVHRLARTLDEKTPQILVSRKTDSITNFVKAGFTIHKSDYIAKKLSFFTTAITVISFIMAAVLTKDIALAVFCATGAAVLQIPLAHTLIGSLPSSLMQKSLEKVGALVNGWQGIDQLSKTTHVSFDSKNLFPSGSIILHGIKTFEKERLDLAILYAASVLIEKCDNLRPIFMSVIENKTEILYPVESCEYVDCQGYIAWIENTRVLIGNRALMENYIVDLPPVSMETNFSKENKKPIYLAVNGKLFGMFIVSYHPDESVKENLESLVDKGVNIILTSNDFNVDSMLIERTFGIPSDYVQVLDKNSSALMANFNSYTPSCEVCMAHLDSIHSLTAGFFSAETAKWAESTCSLVQCISVVIGAILALVFTWSKTLPTLPLQSILMLSLGWAGLSLLGAVMKKY